MLSWQVLRNEVTVSTQPMQSTVVVSATYLPLRRWRHVLPFLRLNRRVKQRLQRSRGLLRYGLAADLLRKQFWTISIWTAASARDAFIRAEPHATAIRRFPAWAAEGAAFVEWTSDTVLIDWNDVQERLKHPTFRLTKE